MCKYCNWVLNILHQLQMSQDRIFFLAHSLLLETLHFPPKRKKYTLWKACLIAKKKWIPKHTHAHQEQKEKNICKTGLIFSNPKPSDSTSDFVPIIFSLRSGKN